MSSDNSGKVDGSGRGEIDLGFDHQPWSNSDGIRECDIRWYGVHHLVKYCEAGVSESRCRSEGYERCDCQRWDSPDTGICRSRMRSIVPKRKCKKPNR
jgi:hypothetical protein